MTQLSITLSQLYSPLSGFPNHIHSLIRDNMTFRVLAASRVTFTIETERKQLCVEQTIMPLHVTQFGTRLGPEHSGLGRGASGCGGRWGWGAGMALPWPDLHGGTESYDCATASAVPSLHILYAAQDFFFFPHFHFIWCPTRWQIEYV